MAGNFARFLKDQFMLTIHEAEKRAYKKGDYTLSNTLDFLAQAREQRDALSIQLAQVLAYLAAENINAPALDSARAALHFVENEVYWESC